MGFHASASSRSRMAIEQSLFESVVNTGLSSPFAIVAETTCPGPYEGAETVMVILPAGAGIGTPEPPIG
jgi:hypothetical protein